VIFHACAQTTHVDRLLPYLEVKVWSPTWHRAFSPRFVAIGSGVLLPGVVKISTFPNLEPWLIQQVWATAQPVMTNRKSHTLLWLMAKSTTLYDVERSICTVLQKRCTFLSPTAKILMKMGSYYLWQKCSPVALISGDIRFMWNSPGSLVRGHQTTVRLSTTAIFSIFAGCFFWKFSDEASSLSSAFQWPQNAWHWMTLNGYFALNFVLAPVCLAPSVRHL